ncbi:MAG TPA: response regulator [Candidatus Methanoperedens sp.]|nr:response regulator [Candidatus Methanoperedens sp.]
MSLVGNLEDLSLPDILQIVSLSRKSGILMLEREGQQGKILIREGRVIQTVSPRPGRTLGELLASRSLVGPEDLRKALELQRDGDNRELLGSILVRLQLMDEASLEKVVQEQIEDAIVYFLSWKEGTFNFELADIKSRGEFSVDPQAFILERGIDTQWLVLEGTRLIDERARERAVASAVAPPVESAGETSFAGLDEGPQPEAPAGPPLVLVDDDAPFREAAARQLGRLGFRVVACEGVAAGLREIEREAARGSSPVVVTGIVMPTLDSQGFLGGLELIEKLRRPHPEVQVVAVTAYPDEKVREKVLEFGGRFLAKPAVAGAGAGDFFAAIAGILGGAAPPGAAQPAGMAAAVPAPPRPAVPAGSAPESPAVPAVTLPAQESRPPDDLATARTAPGRLQQTVAEAGLGREEEALLRDMLRELQNPRATSELGLLVLRFAAELLNRAVLFVVKGGKAVGLGGFGVAAPGGPERQGIRAIAIPLDAPSILADVVARRGPVRGALAASRWNRELLDQLGGQTPAEAVALPLVSGGRVRVILYGDNLPEQRPLAGIRALEIFLAQAGLTLERVLLERKLQEAGRP